ncbi:hypothetical protein E2C01_039442 [Portunus trituberculatus]|uniref:Uncharacterized protein n=1 Tax=Portunus trituberculatus TaxID=210409 RepID=A0A5B7FJV6_PORTR|nr:hypothetical protein [Portunus trituberculatus]
MLEKLTQAVEETCGTTTPIAGPKIRTTDAVYHGKSSFIPQQLINTSTLHNVSQKCIALPLSDAVSHLVARTEHYVTCRRHISLSDQHIKN